MIASAILQKFCNGQTHLNMNTVTNGLQETDDIFVSNTDDSCIALTSSKKKLKKKNSINKWKINLKFWLYYWINNKLYWQNYILFILFMKTIVFFGFFNILRHLSLLVFWRIFVRFPRLLAHFPDNK